MDDTSRIETKDEGDANGGGPLVERPGIVLVMDALHPRELGARYDLGEVDDVIVGRGARRVAVRRRAEGRRQLLIQVPSRAMSTTHARIVRSRDGFVLEDLGSTNGTFVNGESVTRAEVRDGDVLAMGHVFFVASEGILVRPLGPPDLDGEALRGRPAALRTLLPRVQCALDALLRVAKSHIPVLLRGETGSGKELAAQAIHEASSRQGPFVAVNCGALPPTLVEALLFGHAKGAFSGAVRDELGFVRAAEGGTLFLDEVGELPLNAQAALLRVLEQSEVCPVGSTRAQRVDIRVVSATHRPLETTANEVFRRDLLARLRGFVHTLEPLRERREDLGLMVADILGRVAPTRPDLTLSSRAALALLRHSWPMNVRELHHALAAATVLADGNTILPEHLPPEIVQASRDLPQGGPADALRAELIALLGQHAGNVAAVARAKGKAPAQIRRWLHRFGIDPDRYRR